MIPNLRRDVNENIARNNSCRGKRGAFCSRLSRQYCVLSVLSAVRPNQMAAIDVNAQRVPSCQLEAEQHDGSPRQRYMMRVPLTVNQKLSYGRFSYRTVTGPVTRSRALSHGHRPCHTIMGPAIRSWGLPYDHGACHTITFPIARSLSRSDSAARAPP